MRVLVACEESQRVTIAFRELGHEAFSCDLLPCSGEHPEWHIQDDVFKIINNGWDLMIAHPPCTYLTVTGNKWMKDEFKDRFPDRQQQREEALAFFIALAQANVPKICVENPMGVVSSLYRPPTQYIHPYYFGENQAKKTGLWLKNLPMLRPTKIVKPEYHIYKNKDKRDPAWHMETRSLPPDERSRIRSQTSWGIARAMASQWGQEPKYGLNYRFTKLQK